MRIELKILITAVACCTGMTLVTGPLSATETTMEATCVDQDGDGWGWNGESSCMIENIEPDAVVCVDTDGDGYGWNGVATCVIAEPTACIDEDGDGWGWNGESSCLIENVEPAAGLCVDTDGDGYGWNGIASCLVNSNLTPPNDDEPNSDSASFNAMLEGVRSYGCSPGAEGFFTTEYVEVFANGITTNDLWLYEEQDCNSRPLTFSKQLSLQSYALEMPLTTNDGKPVYAIKFETTQLSSEDGDNAFPVGTTLYDIVALEDGGVTLGTDFATTPEERPLDLLSPSSAVPVGKRASPATVTGLMHTWNAACFNGKIHQRVFDEQHLTETVQYFADDNCTTDSFYSTRINTWDVTYGEAVTTVFGQPALRVRSELIDSRLGDIVIGSGLPSPPALSEIGKVFEDIWSVFAGELVLGTCLDKSKGNCGSIDNIPNILNLNIGNRFELQ